MDLRLRPLDVGRCGTPGAREAQGRPASPAQCSVGRPNKPLIRVTPRRKPLCGPLVEGNSRSRGCLIETSAQRLRFLVLGSLVGGTLNPTRASPVHTVRMNQPRCLPSLTATTQMPPPLAPSPGRIGDALFCQAAIYPNNGVAALCRLMAGIGKSSIRPPAGD